MDFDRGGSILSSTNIAHYWFWSHYHFWARTRSSCLFLNWRRAAHSTSWWTSAWWGFCTWRSSCWTFTMWFVASFLMLNQWIWKESSSTIIARHKCFFIIVLKCFVIIIVHSTSSFASCSDDFIKVFWCFWAWSSLSFGQLFLFNFPFFFASFQVNFQRCCAILSSTNIAH